jgi:hypothetical protein
VTYANREQVRSPDLNLIDICRPRWRVVAWLSFAGACLGARLVPPLEDDRGIFVSVAERLLAGATLYAGVYDNKDPLFFYALAIQRLAGPIAQYLFELGMVLTASASVYTLGRHLDASPGPAAFTGFVATPLLVTGAFYTAGGTSLPATALCLLACALFADGRAHAAGAVVAIVLFMKATATPLPTAFCFTYLALRGPIPGRRVAAVRGIVGFTACAALVLMTLHIRGELAPYFETQMRNILYTQAALVDNSSPASLLASHLETMFLGETRRRTLAIATGAGAILMVCVARRSAAARVRTFAIATLAALSVSIGVLAVTGIWGHHAQLLYFGNALVLACLGKYVFGAGTRALIAAGVMVIAAELLSGALAGRAYIGNPLRFGTRLTALRTPSAEAVALIAETGGTPAAYARIGLNDDSGHAYSLGAYTLACPDFHQYYFYSSERLSRILECASHAPFLLVSESVQKWHVTPVWLPPDADRELMMSTWNDYVGDVEALLARDYRCRTFAPGGTARVCRKLPSS